MSFFSANPVLAPGQTTEPTPLPRRPAQQTRHNTSSSASPAEPGPAACAGPARAVSTQSVVIVTSDGPHTSDVRSTEAY